MSATKSPFNRDKGFSLVEVSLCAALVGLLAVLVLPTIRKMRHLNENIACANNLRQIGQAMLQKVADNGNFFPKIENDPDNPIYAPEDGAQTLLATLEPYGMDERTLRCPSDVRGANYFKEKGSSYEWIPLVDGEIGSTPRLYLPSGTLTLPYSRIPATMDYAGVHHGRKNMLFADGHVQDY